MHHSRRPWFPRRLARLRTGVLVLLLGLLLSAPFAAAAPLAAQTAAPAQRWIVRLDAPPLAQAPLTRPEFATLALPRDQAGRLDVASPAAQQYIAQLDQQQRAVAGLIQQQFPAAAVHQRYQIVMNGIGLALPNASAATLAGIEALPGVAAVYPDTRYERQMYNSNTVINAPALWDNPAIGGQANAGAGIKIAIIDQGIALANPMFDPTGYSYPEGYPLGDTAHTSPKVIAARAYFRPDIAPSPGHETPQPGPDDSSHGTHVAGIAGGNAGVTATADNVTQVISGVAPRAYLLNYKTFYANDSLFGGAFSIELIAALEDAVRDGADIINNSWGGRADELPGADPITLAAEAAVDAGVTVVFAAGNSGPNPSTAGSPAYGERFIAVGSSTTAQTIAAGFVDVLSGPDGTLPEALQGRPFGSAAFGAQLADTVFGPAPYLPVALVEPGGLACDPLPPGALTGQIALIERGVCEFSLKAFHAQQAGALAAMIFNSEAGGENIIGMAAGTQADAVTIPAIFVQRSLGVGMINWYNDTGGAGLVQIDPRGRLIEQTPDVMALGSSRGPTFQGTLKPDVVAPGVNILSAGFADGEGMERHLGFGTVSGTSMAAPHVAGAAALLKQLRPGWSPADIKAALMASADLSVWLDQDEEQPASVLDKGAGRIDLGAAANVGLLFDPPSLSFGNLATTPDAPTITSQIVTARNVSDAVQTYNLTARATDGLPLGVRISPPSITLGPQEIASFTVEIEISANEPPGDYGALVEISGPQALHIPIWARTLPATPGAKVLLLDNDGSTSLGLPDYSGYYGNALAELGIATSYLDVDALAGEDRTLPALGELQRHEIILWFTGDNFVPSGALPVPTPLTPTDQDVLIAYLQSGGSLLATGQNLADASDIELNPPDPRYGRSDLFGYLGAQWAQDSVFSGTQQLERRALGMNAFPWTQGIALDLSMLPEGTPPSDATSAGNQESVDAVTFFDADPRIPNRYSQPFMQPLGEPDGMFVGMQRVDEPTLEEPVIGIPYRSSLLTFGLEGIRNDTGQTTRQQFLQALLYWHVGRPTVALDNPLVTTSAPDEAASFTATPASNVPASFVRYRWNFGDGSPFVETAAPTAAHTYAQPGTYRVQVEVTDSWGHRALSPLPEATPQAAPLRAQAVPAEPASLEPVTFAETGHTLGGRFLQFWQQHGGLPVFGYPIDAAQPDAAQPDAAQQDNVLRQPFERARFELHPQNAPPYDVLLGRVGVEALEAQGRAWQAFPTVANAPAGCRYFPATQHSLCPPFLAHWDAHGLEFDGQAGSSEAESLALFGLPISEAQQETLPDGSTRLVQWFERARFEHHPENAPPYDVLLGLLGSATE